MKEYSWEEFQKMRDETIAEMNKNSISPWRNVNAKPWVPEVPPLYNVIPEKPEKKQVGGKHYKEMAIQPIDYILRNNLGFLEGNAIKYISRHRSKKGKEDLEKAIHYIEMLIEREYPEKGVG